MSDPFPKMISDTAIEIRQFVDKNRDAEEAYKLLVDLWNDIFDVEVKCKDLPAMFGNFLLASAQVNGMICNFLIGHLPACYMSMRIVLELIIDAVIATLRFRDLSYPDDLGHIRELERKLKIQFRDKCRLLLPKWAEKAVDRSIELWKWLSEYWVHAKGIVKKMSEKFESAVKKGKVAVPPAWGLYFPCKYDESDLDDIREFTQKLRDLRHIIKELTEPIMR